MVVGLEGEEEGVEEGVVEEEVEVMAVAEVEALVLVSGGVKEVEVGEVEVVEGVVKVERSVEIRFYNETFQQYFKLLNLIFLFW